MSNNWDGWNYEKNNNIVKSDLKYFPKIKVVGCGGAGINMINNLVEMLPIPSDCFIVFDSNFHNLEKSKAKNKVQLGSSGQGTGSDLQKARKFAQESIHQISNMFKNIDFVILFYGIGGGTGTGASPIIAQCARDSGAHIMSFVTTPFKYENKDWNTIIKQLEEIKNVSNFVNIISNNVLAKESNLLKAFRYLDSFYVKVLDIIFSIIYRQSAEMQHILGIDVADLQSILQNNGYGFVTVGYGEGENSALQAVLSCFRNQFIFPQILLESAKSIMVNIISNENSISIEDMENIFETLSLEFINKNIKIVHSLSTIEEPNELFSPTPNVKKIFLVLTATGLDMKKTQKNVSQDIKKVFRRIQLD